MQDFKKIVVSISAYKIATFSNVIFPLLKSELAIIENASCVNAMYSYNIAMDPNVFESFKDELTMAIPDELEIIYL